MIRKKFNLVNQDPWLEPNTKDIEDRYYRFENKLQEIESDFTSLAEFSKGHKYFGINYDPKKKGWFYREWAPEARALYLTGDFNQWDELSHPLTRNEFGIWELFLDDKTYKSSFAQPFEFYKFSIPKRGLMTKIYKASIVTRFSMGGSL